MLHTHSHTSPSSTAAHTQSYKPLIYCWRGGKRSGSLALVLEQIGFEASVLEGGYKEYRAQVLAQLQTLPKLLEWRVLTGPTGSGH